MTHATIILWTLTLFGAGLVALRNHFHLAFWLRFTIHEFHLDFEDTIQGTLCMKADLRLKSLFRDS